MVERENVDAVQPGRRERKKAATRQAISTAALELFLSRGFDEVGIREIAERADVAVATVFAHFAGKEALVFDQDEELERSLIAAVDDRTTLAEVLDALESWFQALAAADATEGDIDLRAFTALVESTPALRAYWEQAWRDRTTPLAAAIQRATGCESRAAGIIAALAITGFLHATGDQQPEESLTSTFRILREGSLGSR